MNDCCNPKVSVNETTDFELVVNKLEKFILENIELSKRNQYKIQQINDYFPPENKSADKDIQQPYNVVSKLHYIANILSDSNSILYKTNEALDKLV